MINLKRIWRKWHILIQIVPFLILVILLKLYTHDNNWEIISLNALFTSMIAATIFLFGFLVNGVISDYKESEKLPTEIAASMETIYDEARIIRINKKSKEVEEFIAFHKMFIDSVLKWFYAKERTNSILNKISDMNNHFAKLENQTQPAFMSRLKQEQNNIRKMVIRINNIRDLSFVESAYAVLEALVVLLLIGLVLLKLEPFYESLFFVSIVSFVSLYMLFLIRDLDNPFDYKEYGETASEVSLKPLKDLKQRIENKN